MTNQQRTYHKRYIEWLHRHKNGGTCARCDYQYTGSHDYRTHLREHHPNTEKKFAAYCGLDRAASYQLEREQ